MLFRQRLTTGALIAVLVTATAFGAYSVLAQDGATATPNPSSPNTGGYGWRMQDMLGTAWQGDPMETVVASALGIDVNMLVTELQSGKTLAQIAEARGVDLQSVHDAMLSTMTETINAMVASRTMTQAQGDTYLTWMRNNVGQMPMFSGWGFSQSPGHGMMGGYRLGMMSEMMSPHMDTGPVWQSHDQWMGAMHGGCH